MRDIGEINRSARYTLILLHDPFKEFRRRQAEDLGPNDIEHCPKHCREQNNEEEEFLWLKVAKKPKQRATKIICFLDWSAHHHSHRTSSHGTHRALILPSVSCACAVLAHAISSNESWEETIS